MAGPVAVERARPWAPLWLRRAAAVAGGVYLASVWLDAAGSRLPSKLLPLPLAFFTQVAELFPRAAEDTIEWRVRGWRCDLDRFDEVDVRPFFPIRRDDKENQFVRSMHFYRHDKSVMEALDAYLVDAQNRMRPEERIGGVMLLSLYVPIPPLAEPGPREHWMPIEEFPSTVKRKYWYSTPTLRREDRCKEQP